MKKVRILIVEDNAIVAEDLSLTLKKFGYEVVATTDNGKDALTHLEKDSPDIALLDIRLRGEISGIDIAKIINERFLLPFIYLTAYADDNTFGEALLTKPHAYLAKPFNQKDLHRAIELALHSFSASEPVKSEKEKSPEYLIRDSIFIKDGDHFVKILLEDVKYVEANGSYSKVFCDKKTFTITHNLNKMHEKLTEHEFVRIHRSFVVNLRQVTGINGQYVEIKDIRLPVSLTYKKILMERLRLM